MGAVIAAYVAQNPEIVLTGMVALCSGISALVPSGSRWMRVVDAVALNLRKARNDPEAQ